LHPTIKALFVFCSLFMTVFGVKAQEDSGLAVPKVRPLAGTYHDIEQGMSNFKTIDTGMYQIQKFDPGYLHNLGAPGTPSFQLVWDPFKTQGFDLGFHQWDNYRHTNEDAKFFNTQNPYVDLFYVQGSKDMQAFKVIYSQNIKPNWNFSVQFSALNTNISDYQPQVTQINTTTVNTWYKSPNGRYMAIGGVVVNSFSAQENGGLLSDSVFLNSSPGNRTGLPVNLGSTAYSVNAKQTFNETFISAKQYYRFGPIREFKIHDTDSVAKKIIHPEFFVSHAFEYHFDRCIYTDQFPGTRGNPFANTYLSISTNDAYQYEEFSNKIAIGRAEFNNPVRIKKKIDSSDLRRQPFFYQAFAKYAYIIASQSSSPPSIHNIYDNTSAGFDLNKNGKFGLKLSGEYFLEGYHKDDYLVNAHLHLPFIKVILPQFNIDLKRQQASPSYTDQTFHGNHFIWTNFFNKSQFNEGSAYFSDSAGFKLGASYKSASNLIYYDSTAKPFQDRGVVSYAQLFVSKDIRFGHFHFLNNITFQKALSNGYDVRVPEWLLRTSWYFEHPLFKRALLLQVGFDFSYSTSYQGYGYMPEISKFYVQDKITIGNYQVWDAWIAGKVKRFMFFFKMEHLNEGLSGNWYFLVPHYPLYPTSYRVGIRWTFYN